MIIVPSLVFAVVVKLRKAFPAFRCKILTTSRGRSFSSPSQHTGQHLDPGFAILSDVKEAFRQSGVDISGTVLHSQPSALSVREI